MTEDDLLGAIAYSLPIAVGLVFAAAPMVILAVALVTRRPATVSAAFIGGWLLGLAVVGGLVLAAADLVMLFDEPASWASYVKVALGALLIVLAVRKWQARPGPGDEPTPPKWLAAVDTMTARSAFLLAFVLASVNPKHLVLVASGATAIADATSRVPEQAAALAMFVVVASLGLVAPLAVSRALGERSGPVLTAVDRRMTAHDAAIMSTVLLVLGLVVVGNGLTGLTRAG